MTAKLTTVAIAILYTDDGFLMQLRDNIPGIIHPGAWGFFGGHIEPLENPEIAVCRELFEEIEYTTPDLNFFGLYADPGVERHVFAGPLTVAIGDLVLHEGWDLGIVPPTSIHKGSHYSTQAGEERPIAPIHQRILLDFLQQYHEQPAQFPQLQLHLH